MELKEWIRAARERQGLNQSDFGDQLGVVKQAVSHWENGRNECSVSQFLRIARVTKMSPAELDDWPAGLDVLEGGNEMTGWPLSAEVLAALQNASPEIRDLAEAHVRGLLQLAPRPAQETNGYAA